MCGIAGILDPTAAPDAIERMTRALRHRGPDGSGTWSDGPVHLGHTRLAILDLSESAREPMTLGPLTMVYNGEVYNYRELRETLPGPFLSTGDAEVVLHAFARDGLRGIEALNGMFAFAVWNRETRTLHAVRDRVGIKPFFYRRTEDGIAFASEIKALLELGRPSIDPTALRDYFTYKYSPAPKTMYRGIHELPPAHTLEWTPGSEPVVRRYWSPATTFEIRSRDEAVGKLGDLLRRSVPETTVSDVPVGVFLSGGIDSTTVVAHLDRPRTFTLGMDVKHRDESGAARDAARHFDTDHHEEVASFDDLDEAIETVPRIWDQPFGDSGSWASYHVSRMARRHVTVALSGEGGDELFCGYHWYTKWLTHRSTPWNRALAALLPTFSAGARSNHRRAVTGLDRYASFLSPFTSRQKRALLTPELLEPDYDDLWHFRAFWREDLEPLQRMRWADFHTYLPGDLLTKVDRASMAHALEVRPPMLDHRVVDLAFSLDASLLRDVPGNRGKLVVRDLMADRVPPGHFDRAKKGFNLPIRTWAKRNPGMLQGALDRLRKAGLLRPARAPFFTNEQTWLLLVLDRWAVQHGLA